MSPGGPSDPSREDTTRSIEQARLIEEDRAQVAHEIHDGLLPLIFVAGAGVQRLIDNEQNRGGETDRDRRLEELNRIRGWLDDAMRAGRELLHQTHPAELDDRSWDAAASEILTRQFPESSIGWEIKTADATLSSDIRTGLFRIVTEAVRNSIRHGKATEVAVASSADPGRLTVRVRDNGRGFDPDDVPDDRFGIRSMRGRAKLLGGTLAIDSYPGGPTEVRVEIPRAAKASAAD